MNVNNALFSAEQVIDRSIIRSGEGHGGLVININILNKNNKYFIKYYFKILVKKNRKDLEKQQWQCKKSFQKNYIKLNILQWNNILKKCSNFQELLFIDLLMHQEFLM